MFHLSGRIALGMDIRNLFEFERPFKCDREIYPAAEIKEVGREDEGPRKLVVIDLAVIEKFFEFNRQLREVLCVPFQFFLVESAALLRKIKSENVCRDNLGGESFGRRDSDLRAGVRVDGAVRLARDHRA